MLPNPTDKVIKARVVSGILREVGHARGRIVIRSFFWKVKNILPAQNFAETGIDLVGQIVECRICQIQYIHANLTMVNWRSGDLARSSLHEITQSPDRTFLTSSVGRFTF